MCGFVDIDFSRLRKQYNKFIRVERFYIVHCKLMKKVLVISRFFPPCNSVYEIIASLRIIKFCKYLPYYGWLPIVLTCGGKETIHEVYEGIKVFRVKFKKNMYLQQVDKKLMNNMQYQSKWAQSWLRKKLIFFIKELFFYPDEYVSWLPSAVRVAKEIIEKEKIDLIFSSALPPTVHLIAYEIIKEKNLPWVAEYRDLWTYNPYIQHTFLRKQMEKLLEIKVIKKAKMLVTVSEPLAEKLRKLHHKPVEVITNGFDEDDYDFEVLLTPYFSITYTGQIYEGKQDPSLLFKAVKILFEANKIKKENFKIRFYGPEKDIPKVLSLAKRFKIQDVVFHYGPISHKEAIIKQKESTVLLLLNWNSPEEKGVYTGKLFEYLGAGRPILAIPKIEEGVVDELLKKANAGISLSTLEEIINLLENWYNEFIRNGDIKLEINKEIIKSFTRKQLTKKLALLFDKVI